MERKYVDDITFEKNDFTTSPLEQADYEHCLFVHCDFTNNDLSGTHFIDCTFKSCNLGTVKLNRTAFRDTFFSDCKLMGLQYYTCDDFLFTVTFENCMLNYSSFYKMKLKKIVFKNCNLTEADFTEADLSAANFDHCDLSKVLFENTILEKADLRTSYNYSIDPERNKIKKAKFSLPAVTGLLDKYDIEID